MLLCNFYDIVCVCHAYASFCYPFSDELRWYRDGDDTEMVLVIPLRRTFTSSASSKCTRTCRH